MVNKLYKCSKSDDLFKSKVDKKMPTLTLPDTTLITVLFLECQFVYLYMFSFYLQCYFVDCVHICIFNVIMIVSTRVSLMLS